MKTYSADELRETLDKHGKWARGETGGSRAYLAGAYLTGANLADANLADAYLARANLADANLAGANLTGANLTGAYLTGANLEDANLTGANLTGAYLTGAYLTGANLDLDQVEEAIAARWRILPDDGPVIGWKMCRFNVVVCLEIPHEARRSNAPGGRKCRSDSATVIGVWGADGAPSDSATSIHDENFKYRTGETVVVDDFNENPLIECGAGIHFYLTRAEAEAHK